MATNDRRRFERVQDILKRVVRTLDVEERLAAHSVGPVWERAVGERLSKHTRPFSLRAGLLLVEARSASWANEVSLLRETIRTQVNEALGHKGVREVRVRLGGGFPTLGAAPAAPTRAIDARDLAAAEEELGGDDGGRLAARARALQKKR